MIALLEWVTVPPPDGQGGHGEGGVGVLLLSKFKIEVVDPVVFVKSAVAIGVLPKLFVVGVTSPEVPASVVEST